MVLNAVIVKFGGSSISALGFSALVEKLVKDFPNRKVVCVLSAERGVTDHLIDEHKQLLDDFLKDTNFREIEPTSADFRPEFDLNVNLGELKSVFRASLAAKSRRINSVALLGWQAGIRSSPNNMYATIETIDSDKLHVFLGEYDLLFIAGFQGVSPNGLITTFGRGASDLTAVAIAAALNVREVHIFTDVDGIQSANPRLIASTILLSEITYDEALELATFGNKVIHNRAVSLAKKYCIDILLRHYDTPPTSADTTCISSRFNHTFKRRYMKNVVGISVRTDVAYIRLTLRNIPGQTNKVVYELYSNDVAVTNIAQGLGISEGVVSFTVQQDQLAQCRGVIARLSKRKIVASSNITEDLADISLVGEGMQQTSGLMHSISSLLDDNNIPVISLSAAGIRITLIIDNRYSVRCAEVLHTYYFENGGK